MLLNPVYMYLDSFFYPINLEERMLIASYVVGSFTAMTKMMIKKIIMMRYKIVPTIPHTRPAIANPRPCSFLTLISFKANAPNIIANIPRIIPTYGVNARIPRMRAAMAFPFVTAGG